MDEIATKRTYTVEIAYTSKLGAPYTQDRMRVLADTVRELIVSALPNADSVQVTCLKIEPVPDFLTKKVVL